MKAFRSFLESARNLRHAIITVFLVILTILIVYWQDLSILFNEALRSEAVSQVALIPFLVSYLVYRKKEHVKAALAFERLREETKLGPVSNIIGVAICLTAFLVYWYGSYTFYPLEYHIASLLIFVTGVTLVLANVRTLMILIFPILFLAFLAPPPSILTYTVGALLANVNTQGAYALLKFAGLPVSLSSAYGAPIITLHTSADPIVFGVHQASSGIYSLLSFAMFATFLVYISRGSNTRKAILFVLGLLILPIFNILRISLIVTIAHWLGEKIAMNIFHTFTGWLLLIAEIALLLLIGEKVFHLRILENSKKTPHCSECSYSLKKTEPFCLRCGKFGKAPRVKISKTFWMKIMALLIGSYLVTVSIQAPVFAFASELIVAPEPAVSNSDSQANTTSPEIETPIFLPNITSHELCFLYRDTTYEKVAGQDLSLVCAYFHQNRSIPPVYVLIGVADSLSNLHNWEVCLLTWRMSQGLSPLVSQLDQRDVQLTENPRIIAHCIIFRHPSNYTQVALYWYQRAMFKTGLTVESRYIRMNLLILTENPSDSRELTQKLKTMGHSIAVHWEPFRVQSLVSIAIPIQQFLLGSALVTGLFVHTSQYALEQRKRRTNQRIFEKLAPTEERLVYQTTKKLSQETKETTTGNIASALEKATGKATKPNELVDILNRLEKNKIIKKDIINIWDQPRLVWKP